MNNEGLRVRYSENSTEELTLDKEYSISEEYKNYYFIINDKGDEITYPRHWFKIVE